MDNDIATINASVALAHFVKTDVTYDSLVHYLTLQECDGTGDKVTNWTVDRFEALQCLDSKIVLPLSISSPLSKGNYMVWHKNK